jgi:hypothetical protein
MFRTLNSGSEVELYGMNNIKFIGEDFEDINFKCKGDIKTDIKEQWCAVIN